LRRTRSAGIAAALVAALALIGGSAAAPAVAAPSGGSSSPADHYDTSPPLRSIAPAASQSPDQKKEKKVHRVPALLGSPFDPVVQSSPGAAAAPSLLSNFEGIGVGDGYAVNSAPPDPNGAVGPNHYVEIVNQDFAVFDKSGNLVYGPVPTNTVWSGFGGGCESNDDGDATVKYDQLAGRWIISQFSVSTTPYLQCVAVSTSGDPTGAYHRYSFGGFGIDFPDYPKLGVWPDAYYTTFNLFANGNSFAGPEVCAYDRVKMLAGQAASQQCASPGSNYSSMLPSDLDGSTPPPAGSPNFLLALDSSSLDLWKFHVDWTTAANTTFTGPANLPVAGFSEACNGGVCIPQAGTRQQLDSLGDRLMYRLAYRNFGDHEALVVAHSVAANGSTGVRWYELRNPNGTPTVFQQGTYAPDTSYRWMPSAAMDHSGDIALGYSISSSTTHPGIRYTVHTPADAPGTMEAETTVITGNGSQTRGLDRWGDYTSMAVDPADDCTFWYTNQYEGASGTFNWSTRVGTFRLPGCSSGSDYSLSATPSSQTVTQGQGTSYAVNVTPSGGFGGQVSLSASGLPSGATASFSPNPTGASSTLTVNTAPSTPTGPSTVTITGTSGTLSHSTSVTLVVNPAPQDFALGVAPTGLTIVRGSSGQYTATVTNPDGTAYTGPPVTLSVSGLPSRTSASFSPNPTSSSSTLTVSPNRKAPKGTFTLTVGGLEGSFSHSQTVTLTLQ
jgi:hypothetical protein